MTDDPVSKYLAHLTTQSISVATQRASRSDLTCFCTWWETKHQQPLDLRYVVDRDLRDWKQQRQQVDGVAPATINRNLSTLRRFFTWTVEQQLLVENPTRDIEDVPSVPLAPRSLSDQAVDALIRTVRNERDPRLRLRDEALLPLLIYTGLRVQEVCDVQLRDVDLAGGTVTVRSRKGGKARRLPLHPDAQLLLQRYLNEVRCPAGIPPTGSDQEREPFLVGMQITVVERPLIPGIKTRVIRKRITDLGRQTAKQLREAAKRERNLERAERLKILAQQLDDISPHMLRHSLAKRMLKNGAQLSEVQRVLGHTRLSTTGVYLTPSEDDLRDALGRAGIENQRNYVSL
jgi:integrase/recombinase XerD